MNRLDLAYLLVLIGCAGYAMTLSYVHPALDEPVVGWPMPIASGRLVDEPHLFVHGEFWMNIAIAAAVAGASVQFLNRRSRLLSKRQRNGVVLMIVLILSLAFVSCLGVAPSQRSLYLLGVVNLYLCIAVVFAVFGIFHTIIRRTIIHRIGP